MCLYLSIYLSRSPRNVHQECLLCLVTFESSSNLFDCCVAWESLAAKAHHKAKEKTVQAFIYMLEATSASPPNESIWASHQRRAARHGCLGRFGHVHRGTARGAPGKVEKIRATFWDTKNSQNL